jgi:F0F1-type ATP synthase beta subunit
MITQAAQAAQAAQDSGLFGGSGVGTVLLIVGMIAAVAVVSGLGFIARMNDRSAERKSVRATAEPLPASGAERR